MSAPPTSLVKSRENLQTILKNPHGMKKYEIFDRVLLLLWQGIRKEAQKSQQYSIDLHDPNYRHKSYGFVFTEEIIVELIELLKKEYPGVDFTYKETAGYGGKRIEQIIIMDWS